MKTSRSFYSRYGLAILTLYALAFCPVMFGAWRALLSNKNDVKEWLPEDYQETQDFKWFRRHFAGEQFVLVSWEGCTLDDDRLKLLASHLEPPRDKDGRPRDKQWMFHEVLTGPRLLERLTEAPSDLHIDDAKSRLKGLFIGPDDKTTCAIVTLSPAGESKLRKAVEKIREVACNDCGVPAETLRLGGPPVDNVALDMSGEKSLRRLGFIAGGLGLAIAWWCLRSVQLVLMVFTTGIFSAAIALAIVKFSGGNMNAILLTMPSLVYVAAISGAIHLTNYYRESVVEHGVEGAPGRALRHAALPLGLATGTTAVGLLSLYICELVPIQMFGLYSAIGVAATIVPLGLILPAMFQLWPMKTPPSESPAPTLPLPAAADDSNIVHGAEETIVNPIEKLPWSRVGNRILRHWAAVAALFLVVMGVCGYGVSRCETSINLMRFFSPQSEIVQHYTWLEQHLGPLVPMEVVIRFDADCTLNMLERMRLVRRIESEIEKMPLIGSAMSAATFAPELPAGRGWSVEKSTLNAGLERHKQKFVEAGFLQTDGREQLWRISARLGALNNLDYGALVADLQAVVDPIVQAENQRQTARLAKANATTAEPPDHPLIAATYTGLVPLVYKAQRSLMNNLILGFVGDWIAIGLVVIVLLRNFWAGILLTLPATFPACVVFGVMGWTGVLVDTGTVMAPAVALGVTIDDVVHFMLWVRTGLMQGLDRRRSIMLAYRGCAQAIYQSWGVIGLGLSVFALSNFMPTQRFGVMMITLLTASTLGNLVFLPALLASPLGALYERRILQQRARQEAKRRKSANLAEADGPPTIEISTAVHPAAPLPDAHTPSIKRRRAARTTKH